MNMKTIFVMDIDVLREFNDDVHYNLYNNIPSCFKQKKYTCIEVESIPREKEILLIRQNCSLKVMPVSMVVYYDMKIFVIVDNTENDFKFIEKKGIDDILKFGDGRVPLLKQQAGMLRPSPSVNI